MKTFISIFLIGFAIGCEGPESQMPAPTNADEILESFDRVSFTSPNQVRSVIDNASRSRKSVSFIDIKWSPTAAFGKRKFAKFLSEYYQQQNLDVAAAHYIDCTPLTDIGYLHDLPGWDNEQHRINGDGEVIWMENGRVLDVQAITFEPTDELIAKTLSLFGSKSR